MSHYCFYLSLGNHQFAGNDQGKALSRRIKRGEIYISVGEISIKPLECPLKPRKWQPAELIWARNASWLGQTLLEAIGFDL